MEDEPVGEKRLNGEALSGRQLSVAVLVAGLSPAAALAGVTAWPWLLLWAGAGVALGWLALRRIGNRPFYRGVGGRVLFILYCIWGVVLAARTLNRTAARLEVTSGGSPRFWLLLIMAVPLLRICWGKAAPFFRMVEILWLAMAVVLSLVLIFGVVRVEWRYVFVRSDNWLSSALTAGEVMTPALFVLPYIYKVEERSNGRGIVWLSVLGGISAVLCLITTGILGAAAERVPYAFFVSAGLLGKSARCEGLLSVLWLLPDLTLAGLLCRVWEGKQWPALAALLAAGLAMTEISEWISREICVGGTLILFLLALFLPGGKGKIVV